MVGFSSETQCSCLLLHAHCCCGCAVFKDTVLPAVKPWVLGNPDVMGAMCWCPALIGLLHCWLQCECHEVGGWGGGVRSQLLAG